MTQSHEELLLLDLQCEGVPGAKTVEIMAPNVVRVTVAKLTFAQLDALSHYFDTKKLDIVPRGALEKDHGDPCGTSCYGVESSVDVIAYEADVPMVFAFD